MTNNHVRRLSGILLAAAIFSVHPCPISSQELESRSSSTLRWKVDYSSAPDQAERHTTLTEDAVLAALPDAPMPQNQAQDQAQDPPAPAPSETHLNRYPIFSPGLTRAPLSIQDKFQIYTHKAYGPPAVVLAAFGAGLGMLNPPSKYPKEWKDGADAFGRNYGYRLADIRPDSPANL